MADFDYSGDGAALGESVRDTISPFDGTGIDPDEARADQASALAKVNGTSAADDAAQQPDTPATRPDPVNTGRYSANGNELPPRLYSRSNPTDTPDAQPAQSQVSPSVPVEGVTPSVDANAAPGAAPAQPTWADYARRGMAGVAANMDDATAAARKLANQPTLATTNAPLQTRFDSVSQPLNPRAAQYKVGVGSKILRGLEGTAAGIARGGVIGGVVGAIDPRRTSGDGSGYSDPNQSYYQDTANRARTATSLQTQMTQNGKDFALQTTREKEIAAAEAGAGTMGSNLAKDATGQQNADSTVDKNYNESPEGKAAAASLIDKQTYNNRMLRISDAKSPLNKVNGYAKAFYLAHGTLPTPSNERVPAEEALFQRSFSAWQNEHPGQRPGVADIRTIASAAKGQTEKDQNAAKPISPSLKFRISDEKKKSMDEATALYRDGRDKSGAPYTKENWQQDMQTAQNKFEQDIEDAGGAPQHMTIQTDGSWKTEGAGPSAQMSPAMVPGRPGIPARPASPRQRPTPRTNPIGSTINVEGKPMRITGYNPSTGKPIVDKP